MTELPPMGSALVTLVCLHSPISWAVGVSPKQPSSYLWVVFMPFKSTKWLIYMIFSYLMQKNKMKIGSVLRLLSYLEFRKQILWSVWIIWYCSHRWPRFYKTTYLPAFMSSQLLTPFVTSQKRRMVCSSTLFHKRSNTLCPPASKTDSVSCDLLKSNLELFYWV